MTTSQADATTGDQKSAIPQKPSAAGKYRYFDNFDDETDGDQPSHWQLRWGRWEIANKSLVSKGKHCLATLHVFSSDVTVSADVLCSELKSTGGFWLTSRWNYETGWSVKAGYNAADRSWQIVESFQSEPEKVIARFPHKLMLERRMKLTLQLKGSWVRLTVNGKEACRAETSNLNWGRVGLLSSESKVSFDNFIYTGCGRVENGVEDFWCESPIKHPTIFHWKGRDHASFTQGEQSYICPLSQNFKPKSWLDLTKKTKAPGEYVCSLKNGKLAAFFRRQIIHQGKQGFAYFSRTLGPNQTKWSRPRQIHPPYPRASIMPNKIRSLCDGSVIVPVGIGGHNPEFGDKNDRTHGDFYLFKSDDDGKSWQQSIFFSKTSKLKGMTGYSAEEPEVVRKKNGELACFFRTGASSPVFGCLQYITSNDNGKNWVLPPKRTPMLSAKSSFNVATDPVTGEFFAIWLYEDHRAHPAETLPRHRVCIARSKDDMKTWQFLMVLDDFKGCSSTRHYNPTIHVCGDYLYAIVKTRVPRHRDFIGAKGKRLHFFKIDRSKVAHQTWPETNSRKK